MADITILFMGFINQQTSLGGTILYGYTHTEAMKLHSQVGSVLGSETFIFCRGRSRQSVPWPWKKWMDVDALVIATRWAPVRLVKSMVYGC